MVLARSTACEVARELEVESVDSPMSEICKTGTDAAGRAAAGLRNLPMSFRIPLFQSSRSRGMFSFTGSKAVAGTRRRTPEQSYIDEDSGYLSRPGVSACQLRGGVRYVLKACKVTQSYPARAIR